jgi:hypothetical protein
MPKTCQRTKKTLSLSIDSTKTDLSERHVVLNKAIQLIIRHSTLKRSVGFSTKLEPSPVAPEELTTATKTVFLFFFFLFY